MERMKDGKKLNENGKERKNKRKGKTKKKRIEKACGIMGGGK